MHAYSDVNLSLAPWCLTARPYFSQPWPLDLCMIALKDYVGDIPKELDIPFVAVRAFGSPLGQKDSRKRKLDLTASNNP
jgi:hypothetical protein